MSNQSAYASPLTIQDAYGKGIFGCGGFLGEWGVLEQLGGERSQGGREKIKKGKEVGLGEDYAFAERLLGGLEEGS